MKSNEHGVFSIRYVRSIGESWWMMVAQRDDSTLQNIINKYSAKSFSSYLTPQV